jgi:hypothetical protein
MTPLVRSVHMCVRCLRRGLGREIIITPYRIERICPECARRTDHAVWWSRFLKNRDHLESLRRQGLWMPLDEAIRAYHENHENEDKDGGA